MALTTEIEFARLEDLYLDAKNPRLGRHNLDKGLSQEQVLDEMRAWSLEELAVSMLESGFWPQEALIVVDETVEKHTNRLVVIEGNRRLAALKMIFRARDDKEESKTWKAVIEGYKEESFARLANIAIIRMPSRASVQDFLGFRHVTGIKEWNPAEKAEFIAHLIEDEKLTYEQVRKRIGSKTPTVRQNYISYRLLLQMEDSSEIDVQKVENRFSVLYLSLRTEGVQQYLQIDISADPKKAQRPVPRKQIDNLVNFARWLFGDEKTEPMVTDSRQVDEFGRILQSPSAIQYLERTDEPSFAVARRIAGVAESEVAECIERAADEAEEALKAAHHHTKSIRVQQAVKRLGQDALQLLALFSAVRTELLKEVK